MIKLLAFVASIISGAQVDVVYANHQLRGVHEDAIFTRKLSDQDACVDVTMADGSTVPAHEYADQMCLMDADQHPHAGFADVVTCNCYGGDPCKQDACNDGNDPSLASLPHGCIFIPTYTGGDPLSCNYAETASYDDECSDERCDVNGNCVWETSAYDGEPCLYTTPAVPAYDDGCRKIVCGTGADAGYCVWAPDPAKENQDCGSPGDGECSLQDICNDSGVCLPNHVKGTTTACGNGPETECYFGDYCDDGGGNCVIGGPKPEDANCGLCEQCNSIGVCEARCNTGDKFKGVKAGICDGNSLVLFDADLYLDIKCPHGKDDNPYTIDPEQAGLYNLYTIDVDGPQSGCAQKGKGTLANNILVSFGGEEAQIHFSCSEPLAEKVCYKLGSTYGVVFFDSYQAGGAFHGVGAIDDALCSPCEFQDLLPCPV